MRCSRYGNGDRMHVILNGDPLGKWIVLSTWGRTWHAADGGCERNVVHRMNEGYRAWGALKSVLSNRIGDKGQELSIRRSNCTNGIVRSRGMGYEEC